MRNEDIKELFEAKMAGLKAEIKAGNDLHGYKLDELIEYQKLQNGRIGDLEDETRVVRMIQRNPKTSGLIIGLSLLGVIALFIIKNFIL